MKLYTWDLNGFENAYSKYYYMPHLNSCVDGVDDDGHFHATMGECGRASCICAFEDEHITYSRLFFEGDDIFKIRAENIVAGLNMPIGSKVLVIGCAFGYLMEELGNKRMNVWGCDTSPYIHLNTDTESTYPIYNVDVTSETFVQEIREQTGIQYFDYIITEDVLTSYDYYNDIFSNVESVLNVNKSLKNIIHIVDTKCGSPFIGQSLVEWNTVNENHSWLDGNGKK
jgi:hypothetical protein